VKVNLFGAGLRGFLRTGDGMQEAVEAVTSILGMSPCEGSDAVPPNARSHILLLAGQLIGDAQVPSPSSGFLAQLHITTIFPTHQI
jgi:hypothetical protein